MTSTFRCSKSQLNQVPMRVPLRFYLWHRRVHRDEALNCNGNGNVSAGKDIAEQLKSAMHRWGADGLDIERGRVNYRRLEKSIAFEDFLHLAPALRGFDPDHFRTVNERKAFWINLYNVLMIHGLVAYGAQETAEEIQGIFVRLAYIVGGYRYCLDDIEHGILRGNSMYFAVPGARFGRHDPRRRHVVEEPDPRIHFALVCGASSCPPIGIYQADKLETQLELAARSFINGGGVLLKKDDMTLSLSRVFQWYSVDFGGGWMGTSGRATVIKYISRYLEDDEDREFLLEHADRLRVTYQFYDWALNV